MEKYVTEQCKVGATMVVLGSVQVTSNVFDSVMVRGCLGQGFCLLCRCLLCGQVCKPTMVVPGSVQVTSNVFGSVMVRRGVGGASAQGQAMCRAR